MSRYDVVLQGADGAQRTCRLHIEAGSPGEAVWRARRAMGAAATRTTGELYAVYRHRRVRGRRLVGIFGGDDGGTAGVREPRRPRPDLPSLRARLDVPR